MLGSADYSLLLQLALLNYTRKWHMGSCLYFDADNGLKGREAVLRVPFLLTGRGDRRGEVREWWPKWDSVSLFTPSQLTIELASLMAGLSSLCPWRSNLLTTDCPWNGCSLASCPSHHFIFSKWGWGGDPLYSGCCVFSGEDFHFTVSTSMFSFPRTSASCSAGPGCPHEWERLRHC